MLAAASAARRFSSSATSLRLSFNSLVFLSVATIELGSGASDYGWISQDRSEKISPERRKNFNFMRSLFVRDKFSELRIE